MSEEDLASHVREGVLSRSEAGYYCNICPAPLGQQPFPHLQGTAHSNAVFFLTLSQPSRYHAQYRDLPQRIRTALQEGVIVAKEKRAVCRICDVPLSKEKTVNDHLLSSNHVTKVANMTPQPASLQQHSLASRGAAQPPQWPSLSLDEALSPKGWTTPGTSAGDVDSIVADALRNGHVKMIEMSGIDGFQCTVCENTKMITGATPVRQHLIGKTHLKNVKKHELRLHQPRKELAHLQPTSSPSPAHLQPTSSPSPAYLPPLSPPTWNFDQLPSSYHQPDARPLQQGEFNHHENSPHHANMNLRQRSNQQQYNLMNSFSSLTLNVNVGGGSHPPLNPPQQTSQPAHQNQIPPPASVDPFRDGIEQRMDQARRPASPYKNGSSPRGLVVIFNYYFEGQGEDQRNGALQDYENLEKLFTGLGYEVLPHNTDLTKRQTLAKLDEVISLPKLSEVDSFLAFFLSHGANSPDAFRTVDQEIISVEEIIYTRFTDAACPQLRRKPKLFFFNFCRGKTNQLHDDCSWNPNPPFASAPKDVAVIQATLPHFAAKRHEVDGTVFVYSLCEVIGKNARSLDLHDIVLETSALMQQRHATTATPWYIDFRKFYFE